MNKKLQQLGELDGLAAVKFSIAFFGSEAIMLTREAPSAIQQTGVEALIIDQISLSVTTVADKLQLPFVTVYNALLLNREPGVPPFFTTWAY
jgi:zeaxanthin glucosyltransferase